MSIFDAGTEIFYNIPKSIVTGQYSGIASKKSVAVPENIRTPLTGGVTGMSTKMFGTTTPVTFAWSKLGTTSKVLIGAGAGATAYAGYDWLFGGKKAVPQKQDLQQKEELKQDLKQAVTPIYAGRDYIWNPVDARASYQIDMITGGTGSIYSEKKYGTEGGQTPVLSQPIYASQTPVASQAQSAEQKQASGTDFVTIAAVLGIAYLGAAYLGRKKRK